MEATWNPPPNETIWWLVGLFKKTKEQISESGAIQVEADSPQTSPFGRKFKSWQTPSLKPCSVVILTKEF